MGTPAVPNRIAMEGFVHGQLARFRNRWVDEGIGIDRDHGTGLVTRVMEEARDRTWDAQRMSAIGPWAMTWGKLLGAPAFAWYGGLILMLIYLATARYATVPVLRTAASLVCGALLLHAIALNASVLAARKGVGYRGSSILIIVLLLLVVVFTRILVVHF